MLSRWPLLPAFLLSPLLLNQLVRQRADWLLRRQRLLNALPVMGALIGGQQLSQIFTVLALTQSAGISFLQGWKARRDPVVPAMAPALRRPAR
jgi:protein transport protein HofC